MAQLPRVPNPEPWSESLCEPNQAAEGQAELQAQHDDHEDETEGRHFSGNIDGYEHSSSERPAVESEPGSWSRWSQGPGS